MSEIYEIYIRQRKTIFLLLSIYALGWAVTPYKTIFLGLILGTSLSMYNLWLLARRADKFGDAVIKGEKVRSLGTMTRMASAVLAVMIALKYPQYFHLISVVFGLMTSYIVIMINYFFRKFFLHK